MSVAMDDAPLIIMKILISRNWSPLKLVCELLSEPETLSSRVWCQSRYRGSALHVVTAPISVTHCALSPRNGEKLTLDTHS